MSENARKSVEWYGQLRRSGWSHHRSLSVVTCFMSNAQRGEIETLLAHNF